MVRGKPKRTRPLRSTQKMLSPTPAKSPETSLNKKTDKRLFIEGSNSEDLSDQPALEMRIYHAGSTHGPQTPNDNVVYKYKEARGEPYVIDVDKMDELAYSDETEDEISYEDKDKTVSVKKTLIDDYRVKSNYWGPLRIIAENVKVKENGVLKDAIQAKLQHVEIQATDNEGKCVNEHELKILMSQTPGIIPACDPPSEADAQDEGYVTLNLGLGEKYKVLKKAMNSFKKLAQVEPPFNTKIQKVFTSNEGKVTPVTLVTLYPRVNKVVYQSTLVNGKRPYHKKLKKEKGGMAKLVNYYRQNYINWSHRGNVCFSEIKKAGVDFFEDILVENPIVEDTIQELGKSPASSSTVGDDSDMIKLPECEESPHARGSKEFVDDLWQYMVNLVRSDSFLIEFEFEMDEQKWFEVKRAFNMFQLNGEVISDIVIKVASKKKDDYYSLNYYVRCLGRQIKSGIINAKADVNSLLNCLSKDKYICVGLNKETFLYQADQNEMLRQHMKEAANLCLQPFESLHDKRCKGIVKDSDSIDNTNFTRGKISVYGPLVTCKPCDSLLNRLKEIQDPSLNPRMPQELSQRFVKQRYGPIKNVHISDNIKKLFTQTPYEFIANAKRKSRWEQDEESLPKLFKGMDVSLELPDETRPSIKLTEADFEKMVSINKPTNPSSNTLRKVCEECGFQTKTMLALFSHMTDHIGALSEPCPSCTLKFSSREALARHKKLSHAKKSSKCSVCHRVFANRDRLFDHMTTHRTCRPYQCSQCQERFQRFNLYKKHLKVDHFIPSVKRLNFCCRVCNCYFYTADHLLIHKLNQNHCDKEHLKCKICNFSCSVLSAFLNHILNHSAEERENNNLATCSECKKVFFSTFKLNDHLKVKHGSMVEERLDLSTHHNENENSYEGFTCGKCYKVFNSVNALQKHIEVTHPEKVINNDPDEQPAHLSSVSAGAFSCNMCGRKFTSEHFLNSHMKLHTANRPVFQCEECGFVYGKRTQVLEHIRNDHAEQVEKHQQMQQQQQQHEIMADNPSSSSNPAPTAPIYGAQQHAYPTAGQVIGIPNHAHMLQATQAWGNQLKIPSVEQPPEVPYNFQNFNPQFF